MRIPNPFRRTPPLACQELVELVTEYLEGELSVTERRRFEQHIGGCPDCALYVEQMRVTILTVGVLREESVPPLARAELLRAFAGWRDG
jgi:anti-sigma factor RsiW